MDLKETVGLITWVNQHDARVQVNGPSRDIWANAVAPYTYEEAKQAILDHYRIDEEHAVTPAIVRKRADIVRAATAAKLSALTAGPDVVTDPLYWRDRNPGEWDRLVQQGIEDHRADLRARGRL